MKNPPNIPDYWQVQLANELIDNYPNQVLLFFNRGNKTIISKHLFKFRMPAAANDD